MSVSESRLAYKAHYDLLDKALAASNGVRAKFANRPAAWRYRLEASKARTIDRRENLSTYAEGDPLYGASVYDELRMTLEENADGSCWLYIRKKTLAGMEIEEIEVSDA